MAREQEVRGIGIDRRRFLAGAAAFTLLTACGISGGRDTGTSTQDLESLLNEATVQQGRMERELGDVDQLMGALHARLVPQLPTPYSPIHLRLLRPFEVHKENKQTNPTRNLYTVAIENIERKKSGATDEQLLKPSSDPTQYTYHFLDQKQAKQEAAGFDLVAKSMRIGDLEPTNLLDALTVYHETAHAEQNALWLNKAREEGPEAVNNYQHTTSTGNVIEMEVDATLRDLNVLNIITNGRYMNALRMGNVRFSEFKDELGARPDQAEDFEALSRQLASKAGIVRDFFINTPAFTQALINKYKDLSPTVYRQSQVPSAPDFLAA